MEDVEPGTEDFGAFFREHEPRLRRALVAAYGPEVGREAAADALAYAWERWSRIGAMANPAGYLYRVGQSRARKFRRRPWPRAAASEVDFPPEIDPGLRDSLLRLSTRQRVAVVLVHGFDWPPDAVAALLGISPTTVRTHVDRALTSLRGDLEVEADV